MPSTQNSYFLWVNSLNPKFFFFFFLEDVNSRIQTHKSQTIFGRGILKLNVTISNLLNHFEL